MFQILPCIAAAVLVFSSISAVPLDDQAWSSSFKSKLGILPQPKGDCFVCFYEQVGYAGAKFCVGKQDENVMAVNPITAPATIESIAFGKGCDLVVNVRMTDVPFGEHVDVISKNVANTGYNASADEHSIEEIYVEEAGRACFLGVPDVGDGYGVCYTDDVPAIDKRYRNSITELMVFKSDAQDFDVVIYEEEDYNKHAKAVIEPDGSQGVKPMPFRFTGDSKNLMTNEIDSKSGVAICLQNKVRSIKFVAPVKSAT